NLTYEIIYYNLLETNQFKYLNCMRLHKRRLHFALLYQVQLHVVDRHQLNALETGMRLLEVIHSLHPSEFEFIKNERNKYFFDLLAGTKRLKTYITHRKTDEFLDECRYELDTFQKLK